MDSSIIDSVGCLLDPLASPPMLGHLDGSPDAIKSFTLDSSSLGIPSSQDQEVPIGTILTRADFAASRLVVVGAGSVSSSPSVPTSL